MLGRLFIGFLFSYESIVSRVKTALRLLEWSTQMLCIKLKKLTVGSILLIYWEYEELSCEI